MLTKRELTNYQNLSYSLFEYATALDKVFPQSDGSDLTFKASAAIDDLVCTIKYMQEQSGEYE